MGVTEAAHAVYIGNDFAGSLIQRGDVVRFVFSDAYWHSSERAVLGMWFEDNPKQSPQAALRLPPWFSNLLPEGRLREWIARERGVSAQRELQLLLHIGGDLPGAVRVEADAGNHEHLQALSDEAPVVPAHSQDQNSIWKFSLAGVGMKFSMIRDGDRLTLPGRNADGDWIVKLPSSVYPQVPENELAMMQLASSVGISVPEIDLVHRDQLPDLPSEVWPAQEHFAYAIKRFDRSDAGGRIHIEDFAQVRGWYPDAKYDGSFTSVAALAYRKRDLDSLREFTRRLTFNFLVGNGDAHLKNWSFTYPDSRIATLSPAYDLVSTGPYYPSSAPENAGLKFGGTKDFARISRSSFEYMQSSLQVGDSEVLDVVDATLDSFELSWSSRRPENIPAFVETWIDEHATGMLRQLRA